MSDGDNRHVRSICVPESLLGAARFRATNMTRQTLASLDNIRLELPSIIQLMRKWQSHIFLLLL